MEKLRCRTVFISDCHLGAVGGKTAALQDFLYHIECEKLFLVGDIVDGWVARQKSWRQEHSNVVQTLLGMAKKGCKVYYTPGNHDAFLRRLNGQELGAIEIDHSFVHTLLDGRELLVVHGDLFDPTCTKQAWLAWVGAWMYEYLQIFNQKVNKGRLEKNRRKVDFAGKIKRFTKGMTAGKENFEDLLIEDARAQGFDGVVCGHVHRPAIRKEPDNFLYINTGDWVEHATAVIEDYDGNIRLINWTDDEIPKRTIRKKRKIPIRLRRLTTTRRYKP
jgi:UDP-2,3-diacylglucosamine pyrophosphatase LpxH